VRLVQDKEIHAGAPGAGGEDVGVEEQLLVADHHHEMQGSRGGKEAPQRAAR